MNKKLVQLISNEHNQQIKQDINSLDTYINVRAESISQDDLNSNTYVRLDSKFLHKILLFSSFVSTIFLRPS